MKEDHFTIGEGGARIYEDEDLEEYENDNNNINFLKPSPKNMNHAVKCGDYDNQAYDQLLSVELMLPNESVDGFIRGTVIKQA